jgi:acetyltransferase
MKNGDRCLFRPILPEDEPQLLAFIAQVTKEDLYYRYFSEINEFTHDDLANMTQIDYDREMAFVAVRTSAEERDPRRDAGDLRSLIILMPSLPFWSVQI